MKKKFYIMTKLKVKPKRSQLKDGDLSRKRFRYSDQFKDVEVCRQTFLVTHSIDEFTLKALVQHFMTNGLVSRTHGKKDRLPKNAYSFDDLRDVAQFISNYAEEHGLPQPAAINRNIGGHILLPCSEIKQSLYRMYKDVCTDNDRPAVGHSKESGRAAVQM